MTQDELIEMAECSRCGNDVDAAQLVSYGSWKLCELCELYIADI